jgi:hypothetical protein
MGYRFMEPRTRWKRVVGRGQRLFHLQAVATQHANLLRHLIQLSRTERTEEAHVIVPGSLHRSGVLRHAERFEEAHNRVHRKGSPALSAVGEACAATPLDSPRPASQKREGRRGTRKRRPGYRMRVPDVACRTPFSLQPYREEPDLRAGPRRRGACKGSE